MSFEIIFSIIVVFLCLDFSAGESIGVFEFQTHVSRLT